MPACKARDREEENALGICSLSVSHSKDVSTLGFVTPAMKKIYRSGEIMLFEMRKSDISFHAFRGRGRRRHRKGNGRDRQEHSRISRAMTERRDAA